MNVSKRRGWRRRRRGPRQSLFEHAKGPSLIRCRANSRSLWLVLWWSTEIIGYDEPTSALRITALLAGSRKTYPQNREMGWHRLWSHMICSLRKTLRILFLSHTKIKGGRMKLKNNFWPVDLALTFLLGACSSNQWPRRLTGASMRRKNEDYNRLW